jgi:FixJ family two-component response regulator
MSGYTDRTLQETEQLPADVDVMQKPFTSTVLATRVRRALDNGRPDVKRKTTSP